MKLIGGLIYMGTRISFEECGNKPCNDSELSKLSNFLGPPPDEVVPFNELRDAAFKAAAQFARKPARSLRCCKRLLNYSLKDLR